MKVLALVLLVGCGAHAAPGLAWPKLHASSTDGGQSLAPRGNNPVAAAAAIVEDEPVLDLSTPVAAPVAPVAKPAEPGVPIVKPTASEDPLLIEDTVIEVED